MAEPLPSMHKAGIPSPIASQRMLLGEKNSCVCHLIEMVVSSGLGNNSLTWDFYFWEMEHWTIGPNLNLQACHCMDLVCGLQNCQPDGHMWLGIHYDTCPWRAQDVQVFIYLGCCPCPSEKLAFLAVPFDSMGYTYISDYAADQLSYTYRGCFPPWLWISWCWQVMA